tara:strand:- start:14953 stop:15816 length:864 start_codon:yes stop_codon:yes gene_type:complete
LLKFRLSITVVFSAAIGYLLGFKLFDTNQFILLILGGFFVTGSANCFNQILEAEKDKVMKRTSVRPLPQRKLNKIQAILFGILTGFLGLYMLNQINPYGSFYGLLSKSSFFGLISMFLYVFSYTPLKRVSTISIFVGAIPGAIPFLLGYVAATDDFGLTSGILFAIQFFWQFPHFISISWLLDDDYKKAGFKMLFGGKKNSYPVFISILTSIVLLVISMLPYFINIYDAEMSMLILSLVFLLGIWFIYRSYTLLINLDDINAKKLMLASIIYLPALQILYVIDRFVF